MTTSQHLGLRDALADLCRESWVSALSALAGGRIYENRELALDQAAASQIDVQRIQSEPLPADERLIGATAPIDWFTVLRVRVKARKSGDNSAELVADDIFCSIYERVMQDQSLGGRAMDLTPGVVTWDQEESETPTAVVTWDIQVRHRTQFHTIAA